jgi:hypothetical protein
MLNMHTYMVLNMEYYVVVNNSLYLSTITDTSDNSILKYE